MFALLLAVRSLAPAGFMPAFDHGAVTIVVCPDAAGAAPMAAHHRGEHKGFHQPCPYAAASAVGTLPLEWAPLLGLALLGALLPIARLPCFATLRSERERPPTRGPPLRV